MTWLQDVAAIECCDIVTTGRRTGQRHAIEIWFGIVDDTMYLVSGNGTTADWYRNMLADPVVTVRVDGVARQGHVRVVDDADERRRVGDVMGAKYVYDGDPSIGLTYSSWCYEVPAVAIEFGEAPR